MDTGVTVDTCSFDLLFARSVPHILEKIFFSMDYQSFTSSMKVNKTWNHMLTSEPYLTWTKTRMNEKKENDKKLWWASKYGNLSDVNRIISGRDGWVDLNYASFTGDKYYRELRSTPLFQAASNGHLDVVKALLNAGADPNRADEEGKTPLLQCASTGWRGMVELLLDSGADPNKASVSGYTPIQRAARYGKEGEVKLLLERGADPNSENNYGDITLHMAADSGYSDVVELLLNAGADPNKQDYKGCTTLHIASMCYYYNKDVVKLLLKAGADPNKTDRRGKTALHYASKSQHIDVVETLLDGGAQTNKKDNDGCTPLDVATDCNDRYDVVRLLLNRGWYTG